MKNIFLISLIVTIGCQPDGNKNVEISPPNVMIQENVPSYNKDTIEYYVEINKKDRLFLSYWYGMSKKESEKLTDFLIDTGEISWGYLDGIGTADSLNIYYLFDFPDGDDLGLFVPTKVLLHFDSNENLESIVLSPTIRCYRKLKVSSSGTYTSMADVNSCNIEAKIIADHFVHLYEEKFGKPKRLVTKIGVQRDRNLLSYSWKSGNKFIEIFIEEQAIFKEKRIVIQYDDLNNYLRKERDRRMYLEQMKEEKQSGNDRLLNDI